MESGVILKGIGGFYYVRLSSDKNKIYECHARGVFRKNSQTVCVGDSVNIEIYQDGKGYIKEVMDRKNVLTRPFISNIDQILIVVSTVEPKPNLLLIDKIIAICEHKNIEPIIAVTKNDIQTNQDIKAIYQKAGFAVYSFGDDDNAQIDMLKDKLCGKITALQGNSGVGKSTLLNKIDPNLNISTGEISRKLGRGRHTTRHVELFELENGGYIADTPGFSSLEVIKYEVITKDYLIDCFRDLKEYASNCQFTSCSHTKEKGCGVVEALNQGLIAPTRHQSYVEMFEEAKKIKEWELKK